MGSVWEAFDETLDVFVALKEINIQSGHSAADRRELIARAKGTHVADPTVDTDTDTDTDTAATVRVDFGAGPDEDLVTVLNRSRGELAARLGITVVEAGPDRVVATMPVEGNRQPYGLLHGGASVVLAETIGSLAAAISPAAAGRVALGIEINAAHHRAARSGTVTATATAIQVGATLATYDIRIVDESGRPVCTSRLTCLLRDAPPGAGN
ncbi:MULTISPECIES: hotdog fold thioesterase [unclassified Frankia]|uniref:hotdog fold thioesterase n=1 Tax=unclassified Frankia TaxID=2632575 RepID=UPI002AD507EF|nr:MULTISPECIES: hotdog fold thioesterase [unclassified Frankia]